MSSLLRRLPLSRLLLLCASVVMVGVACTALASALADNSKPAPKPLADAVHQALAAATPAGFSAHVKFENHLLEGANIAGQEGAGGARAGGGLIESGAEGRVWIASDGQVRLELQSEKGATQILYDGGTLTVYQASSNTLYQYTPPARGGGSGEPPGGGQVPSVAEIQEAITNLMGHANLSGAVPTNIAGAPAYSVRISPRKDGGLVGGAELAWDATHGVPLRLALYAKGDATPVLALTATEVSYGPVSSSVFSLSLPSSVKTTKINTPSHTEAGSHASRPHIDASTRGLAAVQAKLPFGVQAPPTLAGMQRHDVRLIEVNGHDSALIGYGEGLGGIVVIESEAKQGGESGSQEGAGSSSISLPHVSIAGAKATELPTALGTILSFSSGGIDHILAGSVTPAVLQTAARGL